MSEQESKCETCKDLKGWTEIGGYWMPCPDCQPSATETPSVRELWASGTLYSDKAHTQPALPAVRPLVLASDFTALEKQRDELRTQLAAAQAALRKWGGHTRECMHDRYRQGAIGAAVTCSCGFSAALSPATGEAE